MKDSSKSKSARPGGSHFLADANDELASLLGELEDLDLSEAVASTTPDPSPEPEPPKPVSEPLPRIIPQEPTAPDLESGRRIAQLEAELETVKERANRAAGDFANYRKRLKKERDDAVLYANERVFKDLLTVVDNFQLALKHSASADADSVVDGVKMTYQQMLSLLARHGMEPFESLDTPFDPRLHQAISRVVRSDVAPGTVVSNAQQGFTLKGRLLRPALVSVAVAKDGDSPPARLSGEPGSQPDIALASMQQETVEQKPAPTQVDEPPTEAPPAVAEAPAAPTDADPLAELERALLEAAAATDDQKAEAPKEAATPTKPAEDDWDDEWDDGIDAFFAEIAKSDT